jgi:hypothetical protein
MPKALTAATVNETSGNQPCQLVKNSQRFRDHFCSHHEDTILLWSESESESESGFSKTDDLPPVSPSWRRTPSEAHDQIFYLLQTGPLTLKSSFGLLSDERTDLSLVNALVLARCADC